MLANRELLALYRELEGELQARCPDAVDYFPVIRAEVYLSQRRREATGRPGRSFGQLLRKLGAVLASLFRVPSAYFSRIEAKQLFLAPAQHRNFLMRQKLWSKHLDSLTHTYASGDDLVWESGSAAIGVEEVENLPMDVSRAVIVLSRLLPKSKRVKTVEAVLRQVLARQNKPLKLDPNKLVRRLVEFDLSRACYRGMFSRSALQRAYIVVFYSLRHAPVIAALNDLGISTCEYQHGIQSNIHPIYTGWEHVEERPASIPDEILVWDDVSRRRIDTWAADLGVTTRIVGNLWYSSGLVQPAEGARPTSIVVALQHYPEYFNPEIFDAVEQLSDVQWVFREHPIYTLSGEDKRALLARYSNVRIVGVRDETLDESLANCMCCITGFSTVGLEALMMGAKTIFTHETARIGLADYIDGANCFYAETADDILAILQPLVKQV